MDPVAGEQDEKSYGYDFIWETAGKQQVVSNYCFYGDYLAKKGMLEQVRDFFSQSGGKNGDVANHNYDKALPWPFDEEDTLMWLPAVWHASSFAHIRRSSVLHDGVLLRTAQAV